ncbi:tRNA (adenosine(37)-N6)-dimethylallyltransferase MiaA [Tautonia plasticadhaerens]|uniref:tRNA dimethylallyltransferase n=1 Tax=Tautonia plasticadhaerens TaxID=2527974 RepID=A0A518H2Z0_9BACT|nr:tRNA (adenosine(37)-N6)-dimethylallyltransferase MiaA [Tautonia plasticadhaerens]QDV35209.1 IPP transferase [Tautonia plasticadhaerens]
MTGPLHRARYLTGPTASGKTAVGVALAERWGAEVIALDSMTLYRGMEVGTAKPTEAERRGVPHHLIDVLDPWESASVAWYRDRASAAVLDVEARGRIPLFVGGTPMYLKALLRGLFEGPPADPALRAELEFEADRLGDAALHDRLAGLDPPAASRLHPNDRRRVIRALEVVLATGLPLSDQQREHDRPAPPEVPVIALDRPRGELRGRIDRRVGLMFAEGLVDEVRRLVEAPRPLHPVPSQGVGYGEVVDLLAGRVATEAEAIARIQARTRQFAKRQMTWFRGLDEVELLPVPDDEPPEATAARVADRMEAIRAGRG